MTKNSKLIACALCLSVSMLAGDSPEAPAAPAKSEVEQLKQMLLDQQKQIDELRRLLLSKESGSSANAPAVPTPAAAAAAPSSVHPSIGEVASTTPVLPPVPASSASSSNWAAPIGAAPQRVNTSIDETSPLQLKIGDAYITPVGFMDMTAVSRSTNPGSGIGTNFGSIAYDHTQQAALTETRLSIQNSRLGARFDSVVKGMKVLGYWESDFLGQLGAPPNGGLAVTSNPYVFRMRLYWVDVRKDKFEFLAGQSWSLMTPNRKGISPLPGDIFYSQDVDVNYQLGLVWGRIPGFRFGFHPSDKVAIGIALENSEPYVGGGNGGSADTLPALVGAANAVSGAVLGGQINNGASVISSAALAPDIIVKAAFDPTSKFHFEIAGVEIANKIADPASTPAFRTSSKVGGGGSINLNYEVAPGLRILLNNFWSAGGGRYIFGQAPDFIIRGNGDLSLVRSGSEVAGLEFNKGKNLFYGYYGGVYIPKNLARDNNGALIGYGPIANDGQNRTIQEITFGSNTTLAKDAKWGALNLMFQFSYLQRNPWLVTGTSPSNAHLAMGFVNLRYTLPGSAPTMGK